MRKIVSFGHGWRILTTGPGNLKMADHLEAICEAVGRRCESGPLPFVVFDPDSPDGMPTSVWSVTDSGNYETDFTTGVVYAEALMRRASRCDEPFRLVELVLGAIVQQGQVGNIERGFLAHIAHAAARTAFN